MISGSTSVLIVLLSAYAGLNKKIKNNRIIKDIEENNLNFKNDLLLNLVNIKYFY